MICTQTSCVMIYHYSVMDKKMTAILYQNYSHFLVPETGVEPVRLLHRGILSPLRLPIPPLRHFILEAPPGFGPGHKGFADLGLTAWLWCQILCKKKWSGKRDSNSRHLPWQGNALPLSHSRIQNNYQKKWWEQQGSNL